ncbi:MAG TPA: glycosyltransferase family 39 protein [Steroidobacteraceae bacterium]|jgi:hypothetical protein
MSPSAPATRVALALIILVTAFLSTGAWRVYGHTWDEPEHLAAGIELLDRGRYEYDTEHPPVARILMAFGPYLAGARSYGTPPPDGVQEGVDILYRSGHYDEYLMLARAGMMPFYGLLLLAMWLWARRILSNDWEALFAVVLLATIPPILGHAALAALDVSMASTSLLALYTLQAWIDSARWRDAALFGAATGLAFATKFSSIPFILVGMLVLGSARVIRVTADRREVADRRAGAGGAGGGVDGRVAAGDAGDGVDGRVAVPHAERPQPRLWNPFSWKAKFGGLALAVLVGLIPIIIAYGIHSADPALVTRRFDWALGYLLDGHPRLLSAVMSVTSHVWLPRGVKLFVEGVTALKAHNDTGHVSFLLGSLQKNGWWYFYLVALAVKTPIPVLVTSPVGLGLMARDGWRERNLWRLAPLLLFIGMLIFASSYSHINIGIRHVLILYPFLALGSAYLLAKAWRWMGGALVRRWQGGAQTVVPGAHSVGTVRGAGAGAQNPVPRAPPRQVALIGRAVIVVLVGWQLSTLYTAYPDYLPYFNEAVPNPQHVLVDSDLDWGQDLKRLEKTLVALKVPRINLAYIGTADLDREPLPPFTRLAPFTPTTGWVAITALAREHWPKGYEWLNAYKPMQQVGKTIDLYYIAARPPSAGAGGR